MKKDTNSVVKKAKWVKADESTQRFLAFSQIRENILFMKDSSSRMVLKCSSVNFLLKSQDEQDSMIISFQRFLNSLSFPIQILVRSKKLDIDSYLQDLNEKAVKQKNLLLQNQTYEYIEYLKKLIEVAQIMKKEFYIIVPFDKLNDSSVRDNSIFGPVRHFWNSVFSNELDLVKIRQQLKTFWESKKWLLSRVNTIKIWLENMWIKGVELDKYELTVFLADYYNPWLDNFNPLKQEIEKYNLN